MLYLDLAASGNRRPGRTIRGTVVAAVAALGLRKAKAISTPNPRIAAGIIRVPILGDLLIASAYGWSGEGPKGRNLELRSAIPQLAKANELPVVIGGDFNLTPAQVKTTGVLRKGELECIHSQIGTCVTNSWKGASTIDLFLVTDGLRNALGQSEALQGQKLATHRPVRISMASHTRPE